jgi:hypothetical protein
MEINQELCLSIKSKGNFVQCTRRRKEGQEFCGLHLKSKNIIRYDLYLKENANPVENEKVSGPYEIEDDLSRAESKRLKETFKKYNLEYTNNKKRNINILTNFFNEFKKIDVKKVIKIQNLFRGWDIRRRHLCNNKEDFGTFESIYEIPMKYYFDYLDDDGFRYGFDIRSLKILFNNDNPINPYNQKPFPFNKINKITEDTHEEPVLTNEQKYNDYLVKVFQKIDNLGHYTDINWFNYLTFGDLKNFYRNANDMFNYRAQLSDSVKKKLVKDGKIFIKIINELHHLKNNKENFLRTEILNEIERICDEGEDDEYKKMGCNLFMTVLVEHNPFCAQAYPHLVQSTFDSY